jgi:hypothetical protein
MQWVYFCERKKYSVPIVFVYFKKHSHLDENVKDSSLLLVRVINYFTATSRATLPKICHPMKIKTQ